MKDEGTHSSKLDSKSNKKPYQLRIMAVIIIKIAA
jgi:hypothetical protein